MFIDETIRLLLDSLGRSEEYEFYLKKFKNDVSDCFALLCPDSHTIFKQFNVLAVNLQFLLRLEIRPALLTNSVDASEVLGFLKKNYQNDLYFMQSDYDSEDLKSFFASAKAQNKIPVLNFADQNFQTALLNSTQMISPRIHFIRSAGAMRNHLGERLLYLRTTTDFASLFADDRALYDFSNRLLLSNPHLHISVCTPFNILKEIFTVKGEGSIIRRGSQIICSRLEAVDQNKLIKLMQTSFPRELKSSYHFENIDVVYYEKNFHGAILLEKHPAGMYLSKYAVGSHARGVGIGQELWDVMIADHPGLFWRSRAQNSINRWYQNNADGFHKLNHLDKNSYIVFWKGIDIKNISQIIEYCQNRPDDFAGQKSISD